MSAAFDTISHQTLLSRLSKLYGIKSSVLNWFDSFLKDRHQTVYIDNFVSDSFMLTSGVPQGSVLAPLLFSLYLKPLADIITNFGFSYYFYADDVQFYVSVDKDNNYDENVISECLTAAEKWLAINNLKLNSNKTQCIIFSRKSPKSAIAFSKAVNQDSLVDFLDSVKNLRFFLDSNLTIEHQIKHVVKKCFFHIRYIGKIRKFLTVEFCKVLVNSLVISQLDYCNSVYYGLPSYLILRSQRVQNTTPRLISCSHKYDHITPALIELHWLPIEYRLKLKILLHVFKVINNLSPAYLTDLSWNRCFFFGKITKFAGVYVTQINLSSGLNRSTKHNVASKSKKGENPCSCRWRWITELQNSALPALTYHFHFLYPCFISSFPQIEE